MRVKTEMGYAEVTSHKPTLANSVLQEMDDTEREEVGSGIGKVASRVIKRGFQSAVRRADQSGANVAPEGYISYSAHECALVFEGQVEP